MKKILYVFCSQNFSGAEIVIERLLKANLKNVIPEAYCPEGIFASRLRFLKIKVHIENNLNSLNRGAKKYSKRSLFKIFYKKLFFINKNLIKLLKNNYSAVHANNLAAAVYIFPALLFSKLFKKKTKWIWSNHDLTYPNMKLSNTLAHICNNFFDLNLVVSKALENKFHHQRHKIKLLHNGLDLKEFTYSQILRQKNRDSFNIGDTEILIGIIGQISERKGHHLLLESFFRILPQHPQCKLIIAGTFSPVEPLYKIFIDDILNAHKYKNVILPGFLNEIRGLYSAIDILVNCSIQKYSEPLGTTIYEAMACKRIVLASKTGGSPEIINDTINGFLFDPDNVDDLTNKLSYLIENINILGSVREAAIKRVEEKFNIINSTKSYNDLVFNLLAS